MSKPYQHNPIIIRVYLLYRLFLAVMLMAVYESGLGSSILGTENPMLFRWSVIAYGVFCLGSFFVFKPRLLIRSENRISFLLIIDLIAMLIIIHSSGGPQEGLGLFIVITAATASIFIRGKLALGYAAMISFFLIAEAIYISPTSEIRVKNIFFAGVLGILVFSTTIAFLYLTEKIRQSDIAAFKQREYAEHLKRLSQNIISRMRTGIIALDEKDQIELINDAAIELLNLELNKMHIGNDVQDYECLRDALAQWHLNPVTVAPRTFLLDDGLEIKISFAKLESENALGTILFIEDNRAILQQAQQLKLASLGQLTATIAHEVRNPLGAIAHAAQLLNESPTIDSADKRLTDIVLQHSDRVNELIENTLQLSRRKEPKPELVDVNLWLQKFVETFKTTRDCDIDLNLGIEKLHTHTDPSQLQQVLVNLCENGLRYGQLRTQRQHITLNAGINAKDSKPYIEVIDDGEGIPLKDRNHIFDPFFTTDKKGTGLGLYISRELCEINRASLFYYKNKLNQSCFKIVLSHPTRRI